MATDSIYRQLIAYAHDLLAEQLTKQGKTDEALSHLEQAVRVAPTSVACHARLAMALARAGKHDRAIAELGETVRLAPTTLGLRVDLADALLAGGETGEAVAECREVLKEKPDAVAAIAILGAALAAEGHVEEAIPHLNRALELDPGNATAHFYLGLALSNRGRPETVLAHLNAAIQRRPDDVPMLWRMAWILATSPDPAIRDGARALDLAKSAVELSKGQELRALDALAAASAETGDFSTAIEVTEQASTMALLSGDAVLAEAIGQRIRLYRQGVPYRETTSGAPAGDALPDAPE